MDTAIRTTVRVRPRLRSQRPVWMLSAANGAALVAILVGIFTLRSSSTTLRTGEVAGETVVAQHRVTFVDTVATTAQRKLVMAAVSPQYRFNTQLAQKRERQATAFFSHVAPLFAANAPLRSKEAGIQRLLPPGDAASALQEFPSLNFDDFRAVRDHTLPLLSEAEAWRFDGRQVETTTLALLSTVPAGVTLAQRTAIGELLATFLTPTLIEDTQATSLRRQQAAAHVAPVMTTVYPGEVIIRRGDLVMPSTIEKLRALGLLTHRTTWRDVLAAFLFAGLIVLMLFWYLHAFYPAILLNPRLLALIDACILVTVLAARVLSSGHVLLPFFLPVAAASTFAAVLIAPEAVVGLTLAIALLAGWIVANSFELTVYYFLSGAAGVLGIYRVRQVKQFIMAGLYIALTAFAVELAFGMVEGSYDLAALQDHIAAAICNGFLSSTLALGGFALLSSYFGVTTSLHLLELAQPSQILLRRLTSKAPGTYNHSVIVSNMVENAAEEIGANSLIAKVSALYHDVGKSANPQCFVENQMGIGNIHDGLRPEESARIIRGHVSQGLRLARQHKLPRPVFDAISEHHGTMTLAFFLHKALEESRDEPVDESRFTYPGPKPQTKETALLMLADGCESAVRASHDHSPAVIRATIEQIFEERIRQGQLDECPLTLLDLDQAKQMFFSVLTGLYHPRIEYPDPADPALQRTQVVELVPTTDVHP